MFYLVNALSIVTSGRIIGINSVYEYSMISQPIKLFWIDCCCWSECRCADGSTTIFGIYSAIHILREIPQLFKTQGGLVIGF